VANGGKWRQIALNGVGSIGGIVSKYTEPADRAGMQARVAGIERQK
jgi:hypothetical protein